MGFLLLNYLDSIIFLYCLAMLNKPEGFCSHLYYSVCAAVMMESKT